MNPCHDMHHDKRKRKMERKIKRKIEHKMARMERKMKRKMHNHAPHHRHHGEYGHRFGHAMMWEPEQEHHWTWGYAPDELGDTEDMSQDESTRLMLAVKSLLRAVERSIATESYDGVAASMATNYQNLHAKIAELYPDDYYVTDVLALNLPDEANDRQIANLVQLAASQMVTYLASIDDDAPPPYGPPRHRRRHPRNDYAEGRDFGRELSDEIMNFTRETLRRALSGIDVALDLDVDEPPAPPKPPTPPEPPTPPKRKNDDDSDDVV